MTGVDETALAELHAQAEQEVADRPGSSCQYAVARDGEVVAAATIGTAEPARYLMFSSTKVVPVALAWRLLGDGTLRLTDRVVDVWPGFTGGGRDEVTVEHLLTHTGGFPTAEIDAAAFEDRERRVAQMEAWELEWAPGSQCVYHATSGHWVLVEVIARTTGVDHREAIREGLLDPLGLPRLQLGVPREDQGDIRPLVACGEPPTMDELTAALGAEVAAVAFPMLEHGLDPTDPAIARFATPSGYAAGVPGAGGVSDASSMALLYQEFLHDTHGLWDATVLHDATTRIRREDPGTVGNPAMRGLGVDIAGDGTLAERARRLGSGFTSPRAFGHNGAGGQLAWADPDSGMSFCFLTDGWDLNPLVGHVRDHTMNRLAAAVVPGS